MGNCQSDEAETVVIHHPDGGKVDRIHWSIRATEVMGANPGYYVALVIARPDNGPIPARRLKLLRPDEALLVGQVYRLVSFEDVLRDFGSRKSSKLGKLLRQTGAMGSDSSSYSSEDRHDESDTLIGVPRHGRKGGWRPTLNSIPELGA